jgi:hypothetical protein
MNGINRRGQKVICIMDLVIEDMAGEVPRLTLPEYGEVYTVEDFRDSRMVFEHQSIDDDGLPGIDLVEIASIHGRDPVTKELIVLGWPIVAFKPVDERRTSIKTFTDLLEPVTEPA